MWSIEVFLVFFWFSFVYSLKTSISDVAALEGFYNSTRGANWNYESMKEALIARGSSSLVGINWNFAKDTNNAYINDTCEPNFQGIMCSCTSSACDIKKLAPVNGNLIGKIPSVIVELKSLEHLVLKNNQLCFKSRGVRGVP